MLLPSYPKAPCSTLTPLLTVTPQIIFQVVTTGNLVWEPQEEQDTVFSGNLPAAMNTDIVVAKMPPEQRASGVRYIPTASYRLHPLVVLNPFKPVPCEHAEKFARFFAQASSLETMSHELLRYKEFDGCVELKRIRDWFIFSVESEGPYTPESLLPEAIKVMRGKIASIRAAAEALLADSEDLGSGAGVGADDDVEMSGE
ncbi:hypothetical protein LXA43DRAFT_1101429 [Ganoderma leucocontextum]|nr:hypothetical protein LXA43DRAFT_1101429 [Ganoderma leucocontextum]